MPNDDDGAPAPSLEEAYQALQFNQQLVQFADSKAGNLIVINSLFIAAGQAAGKAAGLPRALQTLYILLSCAAVLHCLSVISSRSEAQPGPRRDLVFFGDILTRRTVSTYQRDFRDTPALLHMDDVLRRTYVLAQIAQRKFSSFSRAQQLTSAAAVAWVVANVSALL